MLPVHPGAFAFAQGHLSRFLLTAQFFTVIIDVENE
jgi:hypothetical protein